jgi:oligopeptide transport system permease protein
MTDAPSAAAPRSLWADAWSRLLKNRLAVLSLVWIAIMSLVAALAPWIVPIDPQHQEWWIGKRGPLFAHPTLEDVMTFKKGNKAPNPFPASARTIELSVDEVRKRDVRIDADASGLVTRIELGPDYDAEQPQQETPEVLVVKDPEQLLLESPRLRVTDAEVRVGKALPPAFAQTERAAVTLVGQLRHGEKPHVVVATVEAGLVASLDQDGKPIASLDVKAEDVRSASVDGAPSGHRHLLGTDDSGRDILSRVIYGARISLLVGIVATFVSLVIGVTYGSFSAYAGGRTDEIMMRIVDILYAVPFMFVVIILLVIFQRSIYLLFAAIGAVEWLTMARIVRGQVLSLKEKEFIEAARVSGTSTVGIVFGHLVPNSLGAVIVYTTLTIPEVILTEAFLSFLGLSVQMNGQNLESWGSLTKSGMDLAQGGFPWLLVWSSLALSTTLFALNFLGDGLRDALDPRLRGRG